SKPTLLKWSQVYSNELHNEKSFYVDLLRSKYRSEFSERLDFLMSFQRKVEEELIKKNLVNENVSQLTSIYFKINEHLNSHLSATFAVPDDMSFLNTKFVNI